MYTDVVSTTHPPDYAFTFTLLAAYHDDPSGGCPSFVFKALLAAAAADTFRRHESISGTHQRRRSIISQEPIPTVVKPFWAGAEEVGYQGRLAYRRRLELAPGIGVFVRLIVYVFLPTAAPPGILVLDANHHV